MPTAAARPAFLRRWQRLQLQVRCALTPQQPTCIRLYLHAGLLATREGWLPPEDGLRRMLATLLQTAEDEALPWFWRSVCLEHVALPLTHLRSRLGRADPQGLAALEATVQRAQERLPALPARTNAGRQD